MELVSSLDYMPLIDQQYIILIAVIIAIYALFSILKYKFELALYRIAAAILFLLVLVNPIIIEKQQERIKDLVLIGVDRSPSNTIKDRTDNTDKAQNYIENILKQNDTADVKVIEIASANAKETKITHDLYGALTPSEKERLAGSFIISDGLIHDAKNVANKGKKFGPINTILTSQEDEVDRIIQIEQAPAYGIVGENITFTAKIINERANQLPSQDMGNATATLEITSATDILFKQDVRLNDPINITLPIKNAGDNFFTLSTTHLGGELTQINNKRILNIQGVRDRLRVLLVTGLPHNGARVWRNLLKSDANIDLVHFTILRTPDKVNIVPVTELALIPFPVQELFIDKIDEFDLIIFDRFAKYGMLPIDYMTSISKYIKQGGAFLDVSGPNNFGQMSIETDLDRIMPLKLKQDALEQAYKPNLSKIGKLHSITSPLSSFEAWSPWMRQMPVERTRSNSAEILMSGLNDMPLLAIDEVKDGRVAQLASDQIWIWARDPKLGGPYKALLRRLSHWLMKEPQLEDNQISMSRHKNGLDIKIKDSHTGHYEISILTPENKTITKTVTINEDGFGHIFLESQEYGVYTVTARRAQKSFAIGPFNDKEFESLVRKDQILKSALKNTPHKTIDMKDLSTIKTVRAVHQDNLNYPRSSEFLIRDNQRFKTLSLKSSPLLPNVYYLLLLSFFIIIGWYREGKV